jgi:hypothetical protein
LEHADWIKREVLARRIEMEDDIDAPVISKV